MLPQAPYESAYRVFPGLGLLGLRIDHGGDPPQGCQCPGLVGANHSSHERRSAAKPPKQAGFKDIRWMKRVSDVVVWTIS
jgi:hypothetical protein